MFVPNRVLTVYVIATMATTDTKSAAHQRQTRITNRATSDEARVWRGDNKKQAHTHTQAGRRQAGSSPHHQQWVPHHAATRQHAAFAAAATARRARRKTGGGNETAEAGARYAPHSRGTKTNERNVEVRACNGTHISTWTATPTPTPSPRGAVRQPCQSPIRIGIFMLNRFSVMR